MPRILDIFKQKTPLALKWVPHFTSVINWTLRLGFSLLKQIKEIDKPWVAIMDHSIGIGIKKALVVLRVPMDVLYRKGQAIQLEDCECIGVKVSEVVNGESVSDELADIFNQAGIPDVIVKDGDPTLNKGVHIWMEKQGIDVPLIEDIGHVMANSLKNQFEKLACYKRFISLISNGAKHLRQTDLAFLMPPKLRSKGRFQSVSKLGKWAEKMINLLAERGGAKKDSTLYRLRSALPGFSLLKPFIKRFAQTTKIVSQIMEILKNGGLDQESYQKCYELSDELPKRSKVRKCLLGWLERHIEIQKKTTNLPLLVSSDIIETLFGMFKHIIERSPQADMNRTTLLIPALCGKMDQETINQTFKNTKQQELKDWEQNNVPVTVRKKRMGYFKDNNIQKPGYS